MLCVKPTDDKNFEKDILSKCKITGVAPCLITAVENNNLLGYIAVEQKGTHLNIVDYSITNCEDYDNLTKEEREIAEYLVRSAGNYAFNRCMLALTTELEKYFSHLSKFGFKEIDNKYSIQIKDLFKKCENCSK